MRASNLIPLLLAAALPAAAALNGCSSAAPNNKSGGTGGEEESGGSTGTGGKASGGSGGSGSGGSGSGGSGSGGSGSGGSATGGSGSGGSATGGASGGSGGSAGTGGSGTGGASGGSGGSAGTGGAGGASAAGCGMGKTNPTGAVIDNFEGMKQIVEWRRADKANPDGTAIMPMGSMKIMVTGPDTLAVGALASWAAKDRPCLNGSMYSGIQFNATGDVTSLMVRIGTPATYPVSDGGICTSAALCGYAHWQKIVTPSLNSTMPIKVAFSELTAPFGMPAAFDKSALIALVFLTLDPNTAHSFTIDNISFY
jgi:hypothetical protein